MQKVILLSTLLGITYVKPQCTSKAKQKTILQPRPNYPLQTQPNYVSQDEPNYVLQSFVHGKIPDSTERNYQNQEPRKYSNNLYGIRHHLTKNPGQPDEQSFVFGHYTYYDPTGKYYYVEYTADKDGFQAAGDHVPNSAGVKKVGQLGIPSAALASIAGGGLG